MADEATEFDEHTALVVVDVQNDFADPAGSLYLEDAEAVVPVVNRLVDEARRAGSLVVYTADWHPADTPHFMKDGGIWPVHCVAGTWGAEFRPDLRVDGPVVRTGTGRDDGYSGFTVRDTVTGATSPTALQPLLASHGITRLVVTGLALDVCVKETVLDARRLGYPTSVVVSATRAVDLEPGDDRRAIEEMAAAGARIA